MAGNVPSMSEYLGSNPPSDWESGVWTTTSRR
jgi:hypothetical protein